MMFRQSIIEDSRIQETETTTTATFLIFSSSITPKIQHSFSIPVKPTEPFLYLCSWPEVTCIQSYLISTECISARYVAVYSCIGYFFCKHMFLAIVICFFKFYVEIICFEQFYRRLISVSTMYLYKNRYAGV
jgi:hypothetical protein